MMTKEFEKDWHLGFDFPDETDMRTRMTTIARTLGMSWLEEAHASIFGTHYPACCECENPTPADVSIFDGWWVSYYCFRHSQAHYIDSKGKNCDVRELRSSKTLQLGYWLQSNQN